MLEKAHYTFTIPAVLLVCALFIANYQFLSLDPQNPDGAELVMAAVQGGVLHPPGFPVQAWLDKLIVHLPFETPAKAISVLSLLAYCLATWLLLLITRQLNYPLLASLLAAVCFALFPAVWEMAVQPEKYAMALLLLALVVYQSVRLLASNGRDANTRCLALYGVVVGTAIGQHIALGIALPFVVSVVVVSSFSGGEFKVRPLVTFAFVFLLTVSLWYLSLLLLTRPNAWPDWGKLSSAGDVLGHFMRRDLPNFMGGRHKNQGPTFHGLRLYADQLWRCCHVLVLFVPLGIWSLWRSRPRRIRLITVCMVLSMSMVLSALRMAELRTNVLVAHAYLERYSVFAAFFTALFLGAAVSFSEYRSPRVKALVSLVIIGFAVVQIVSNRERVDYSRDHVLRIYSEALGAALPAEAVYVGGNDLESFYGARSAQALRFPLVGGYDWFFLKAVPVLDERFKIAPGGAAASSVGELVEAALTRGMPVYTTDPGLVAAPGRTVERRGLFSVTQASVRAVTSYESVAAAAQLCDHVSRVEARIPEEGHFWSRYLWAKMAEGFEPAKVYFSQTMNLDGARLASNVQMAIRVGEAPADWIGACEKFVHYVRTGGPLAR